MRTFLSATILVASIATASAAQSARVHFAFILARASMAQSECAMSGEVAKAKAYVNSFHSGFDSMHNQEDGKLVFSAAIANLDGAKRMGRHEWCVEYRARRRRGVW